MVRNLGTMYIQNILLYNVKYCKTGMPIIQKNFAEKFSKILLKLHSEIFQKRVSAEMACQYDVLDFLFLLSNYTDFKKRS